MTTQTAAYSQTTSRLRKISRLWSLVIIAIALFIFVVEIIESSLKPQLSADYPRYENLIPLSLFLGVIGLGLAWRWERFGSLLTIISLLATFGMYVAFGGSGRGLLVVPLILLPILVPAILFIICWQRTQGETNSRLV
jgi:hypothetical protein